MALDPKSRHLFVAEIANGSLDDVDLATGRVAARIEGLHEPQGVAWLPEQSEIAVACGDGTVHFYRSSDRRELAHLKLGNDADNVRLDARNGDLVVGYGAGALAIIDPSHHRVIGTLKLPGHPEAFDIIGSEVFVNVPDRHQIVTGDIDAGLVTRTIRTGPRFGNYPLALDSRGQRAAVAFRLPSSLSLFDTRNGAVLSSTLICGDADDLFIDGGLTIVICGEGAVELVVPATGGKVAVVTRPGARTGFYDPRSRHLFIAVPQQAHAASIWELEIRPAREPG